jgi:uncharacterized protein
MHRLIQDKRSDIAELCRRYHVQYLEVFGSAARGDDFDPAKSDADFLVEFAAAPELKPLEIYFDFRSRLSQLLGCPVDLVSPSALRNPYVRADIDRAREVVYAA